MFHAKLCNDLSLLDISEVGACIKVLPRDNKWLVNSAFSRELLFRPIFHSRRLDCVRIFGIDSDVIQLCAGAENQERYLRFLDQLPV